ncbi:hypothetical protein CEUSTIGMA_g1252.t1 [Chlamydomonas eustigma]|uniref:Uncharacterized protein n=1 Tax=Chlamydomonas eustigma TaxID=1157962 RepID=A0A250WSN0_9CHLO|nr:hypothetical protein CEUSTIGMA_g1252.t1 [Chlamydomonas eustigma]|eukprot:GAX73801.1 hypothetical protein CEUSTIGMA_g1252.t1 [Chlamydomonas eustigma]
MTSFTNEVFRGDNENLVDHLIFSCNEHKTRKPLEGIFGRELKPYFDSGNEDITENGRKTVSCGSPPKSSSSKVAINKRATPSKTKTQKRAARNSHDGHASTVGEISPARPDEPRVLCVVTPKVKAVNYAAACPGFFSSPKPNDIPLPSKAFMAKAGLLLPSLSTLSKDTVAVRPSDFYSVPVAAA